jgi:hypothetical protein
VAINKSIFFEKYMYDKIDRYKQLKEAPLWWLSRASNLHASAGSLWVSMKSSNNTKYVKALNLGSGFNMKVACWPVYCMLWGLSFELMLKAIFVVKNPNIKIPEKHDLVYLYKLADLKTNKSRLGILNLLTEYVIWAGKYPVPIKPEYYINYLEKYDKYMVIKAKVIGKYDFKSYNQRLNWNKLDKIWRELTKIFDKHFE